jgi:hypothetical protein
LVGVLLQLSRSALISSCLPHSGRRGRGEGRAQGKHWLLLFTGLCRGLWRQLAHHPGRVGAVFRISTGVILHGVVMPRLNLILCLLCQIRCIYMLLLHHYSCILCMRIDHLAKCERTVCLDCLVSARHGFMEAGKLFSCGTMCCVCDA